MQMRHNYYYYVFSMSGIDSLKWPWAIMRHRGWSVVCFFFRTDIICSAPILIGSGLSQHRDQGEGGWSVPPVSHDWWCFFWHWQRGISKTTNNFCITQLEPDASHPIVSSTLARTHWDTGKHTLYPHTHTHIYTLREGIDLLSLRHSFSYILN